MGKPRALKKKDDVGKSISIDANVKGKHRTFDGDETEDFEQEATFAEEKATKKASKKSNKKAKQEELNEEDNDMPEEVSHQNNDQLLELQRVYEQTIVQKKKKSKRKIAAESIVDSKIDDRLDDTIFEANNDDEEADKVIDAADKSRKIIINGVVPDENKRKRKITDHIEVEVIDRDNNPLKMFALSAVAENFEQQRFQRVPRTKYTTFIAQKKGRPAKEFTTTNKDNIQFLN